ncbi:glycosyltransferase family 4 protein [Autumnicola psychrophila]|uniref:Glycosyltransferase family 4 protein n=1 Tax=Autumnicola psychrophila TaxID=3075592 RepID=A0ABU3DT10_9FLAO|nr:glycosyltransferase family 4 protein [Zunongwangia sp. F225]MDT0686839.1 glycosyltransferase family 4 protein [Zunongwangia sp. F225]
MHIGFLTPEYPHSQSTPSGGLGTSIKNLASSLIQKKIKVSVFVYGQKQDLKFEENGISFCFIKQRKYSFMGWYRYRKYLQKVLNSQIEKDKIEILEAPDWTGITAFMKFSCPLDIRMHGTDAYFCNLEERKQKYKNYLFEKSALKSADALVSVSAFTAEKTKEIFELDRPVKIIPNSIDTAQFLPSEKSPIKNRLLYFGTVIRKKGVLELAIIFNEVVLNNPKTELWLIGKDVVDIFEKRSTLEIFRETLSPLAKEQLKYFPEVSYSEIKEHIAEAAVIVLPSFAEALPMTWLEAMAMEKALVTSNIGWAKEVMIDGKTGYTEDPKNHKAYAEKILHLLNNPEEAKSMGKAARQQVLKKFSTEVVVQQNISFYKELVIARAKPHAIS